MADRRTLAGVGVTPQTGVGPARWLDRRDPTDLPAPPDPETVDPEAERDRFERARESVREKLRRERDRTAERVGETEAAVFDAHVEFLADPSIEHAVADAVDDGLPAPHAVRDAFAGHVDRFSAMDGRMAERADDLRDVRDRLLRALDPGRVTGVVVATGGGTAHAAILLRSLGVPAVVGVGDGLRDVVAGMTLGVDGRAGIVHVDPDEGTRADLKTDAAATVIHERVATRDGTPVEVAANVDSADEVRAATREGADGVGLFRTEFLFLDRESPPNEAEQYETYRAALAAFDDNRPRDGSTDGDAATPGDGPIDRVVVRTLDVGGDKDVPYLDLDDETNGFLGVRGIRFSPSDAGEDLFETQLRALCRAAAHGPLAVMFPMVTTPTELDRAIDRVDDVLANLRAAGTNCARPELGAMVETPVAALSAGALAGRVSFLSIGTNDLSAYVMAARRDLDAVADLPEPLQPAVLRAIARTVEGARAHDAWVGVCGEAGGDPELTPLLVGLGVDELSMAAAGVPRVKAAVRAVGNEAAADTASAALDAETPGQVRSLLPEPES